jgi:hypothetical protein
MADYELDTLDIGDITKEAERLNKEQNSGGINDNYVRMPEKDGFVLLRLLPKLKGKPFFHPTRIHRLGEYPNAKTIFCTRKLTHTPRGPQWKAVNPDTDCPICREYNAMWEKSKKMPPDRAKSIQEKARSIKPVERYYYNCIVRSQLNPKTNNIETNIGPKIFSCGKTVHNIICLSISGNETTGKRALGDVAHPLSGRDFKVVKVLRGKDGFPNYDQSFFEDASQLGTKEQINRWLTSYHDLEVIPTYLTIDQMEEALTAFLDNGSSQSEPKQATFKSSTQSKSAPKAENSLLDGIDGMLDDDMEAQLGNIGFGKK